MSQDDLARYEKLEEAAIPPGGVPPSHKKIDAHGALYPTRSSRVCLALGRENPSEFVTAFVSTREISVVQESGWGGPFKAPTFSIYAPTDVKARAYDEGEVNTGKRAKDGLGRDRYYYGFPSVGFWHRWSEWRREGDPFVSCREMEHRRLREEHGFGHLVWMGMGGWTVLFESGGGGWIVEVGGDSWASKEWGPGDEFPEGVGESFETAKKELAETMLGKRLSDEEYGALGM